MKTKILATALGFESDAGFAAAFTSAQQIAARPGFASGCVHWVDDAGLADAERFRLVVYDHA